VDIEVEMERVKVVRVGKKGEARKCSDATIQEQMHIVKKK
jgi:hypothetical protein